tara:strand:- start:296 stop:745 length:450 start_codon:yes stop_codon:yes gene_type:complete
MKFFFTVCLLIISNSSCIFNKSIPAYNNKENDTLEIIYTQFSRGFFKEIHIEKSKITTYLNYQKTKIEEKKINQLDWDKCILYIQKIDRNKISKLKSPTNNRQTDKVHYAKLVILLNDKSKISSPDFDHGFPPDLIKPLVDFILNLSNI